MAVTTFTQMWEPPNPSWLLFLFRRHKIDGITGLGYVHEQTFNVVNISKPCRTPVLTDQRLDLL